MSSLTKVAIVDPVAHAVTTCHDRARDHGRRLDRPYRGRAHCPDRGRDRGPGRPARGRCRRATVAAGHPVPRSSGPRPSTCPSNAAARS